MKTVIGLGVFFLAIFIALLVQTMIPPIGLLHGARLLFVPALFCYAALVLSYPAMLAAACFTGFLCDLMYLHVVSGQVEIAAGWSIVYFVILGSIAHGFHPEMARGRWWPVIPLSIVGTSFYLLLQFVMISVRREGFFFNMDVAWRIIAPGVFAGLYAPIIHLAVASSAQLFWPEPRQRRVHAGRNY